MRQVLMVVLFLFFYSTPAWAEGQNHPDTRIDYTSATEGAWSAVWEGNGFMHTRMNGSGEVRHSPNLDYQTWDHGQWSATWDPNRQQFRHVSMKNGEVRYSNRIDYTAADKSKWSAVRTGPNEFYHIYVAGPDDDSSDVFGKVIQFYNDNKEIIQVVIQVAKIAAG